MRIVSQACWRRPIIPALWRLRQDHYCQFEASLGVQSHPELHSETEVRELKVQAQPGQFSDRARPCFKMLNKKRARDIAQCKGAGSNLLVPKKQMFLFFNLITLNVLVYVILNFSFTIVFKS